MVWNLNRTYAATTYTKTLVVTNPPPVLLATDSFTGTDATVLETYSANWTNTWFGTDTMSISSNHAKADASTGFNAYAYNAAQAQTANYNVSATVVTRTGGNNTPGVAGRIVATDDGRCYFVQGDSGANWNLFRNFGGSRTVIGSYAGGAEDNPSLTPCAVTLRMVGSTISVIVNGVSRISVTDTNITAKGYAGVGCYFGDSNAASNLDDWSFSDIINKTTIHKATKAGTVTHIDAKRTGGTDSVINIRKNGTATLLPSDVSLTGTSWTDCGALQNTSFQVGDYFEVQIVSTAGSPTELAVQMTFQQTG